MTNTVNLDALKQALLEAELEKLEKDIREYFCFKASPEQAKIWARYLELERERERKEREERKIQRFYKFVLWTLSAICFYSAYQTFQR